MRPKDNERCAVCVETLRAECDAADFGPEYAGKTHLQFMYDKRIASHCEGLSDEEIDAHFRDYALNRMLAPFRDSLNKKRGKAAKYTYESRNLTAAKALSNLCGAPAPNGKLRCIRSAGHEGAHKF